MKRALNLQNWLWTFAFTLAICACWPGHPSIASDVTFLWTAPGDDGNVGIAAEYDLRYANDSAKIIAWTTATTVPGEPAPKVAGSTESFTFDFPNGTWYVALRARDEAFNWSATSNIVRVVVDGIAPAAIIDLRTSP